MKEGNEIYLFENIIASVNNKDIKVKINLKAEATYCHKLVKVTILLKDISEELFNKNRKEDAKEFASWYYTKGATFVVQRKSENYIIQGNYSKRPEKAIGKSNKFILARSMDAIFRTTFFKIFKTEEEAKDMVHAFRMHVEEIVRGKRPIKLHVESKKKSINLERYLRRLVLLKARKQLYRKQKEKMAKILKHLKKVLVGF